MHVLALHGFTGCGEDFQQFSPLCQSLSEWQCPTLPGHGPHPHLDCTPAATVGFLQSELLKTHSAHTKPPRVILGYSMGARAALNLICTEPTVCDALILIGANPGIETESERSERRAADEQLAQQIETGGIDRFLDYWEETPLIREQQKMPSAWRATMLANRRQHTTEGLSASLRAFGQGSCPNRWPELATLNIPTLLITGSEDTKYTAIAQRMQQTLPQCVHQLIEGASHAPHFEAPEATAVAIDQFLKNARVSKDA